jgi:CubicO group peptidase (beta-lactamase class C family)
VGRPRRPGAHAPWNRDTIVNVYSTTKGMAALCLHQLVEQGRVDLDAPVARYWPEFAQAEKETLPVRWLLGHRSGSAAVKNVLPGEALYDWDAMSPRSPRRRRGGSPARTTATTPSRSAGSSARSCGASPGSRSARTSATTSRRRSAWTSTSGSTTSITIASPR